MHSDGKSEELGVFQIVILILSIVVLGALAADAAFKLPPEFSSVIRRLDTVVCLVFLFDFVIRFRQAPSKRAFMILCCECGWPVVRVECGSTASDSRAKEARH